MATTHGPDLETARKAVERLMDDTVIIRRNPGGVKNDVLDPATGQLIPGQGELIYPTQAMIDDPDDEATEEGGGPASLRQVGEGFTTTQTRDQGGDQQTYRMYNLKLPINKTPRLLEGDTIVCVSSRRDPTLPGTPYVIREPMQGTFAVSRKILVERLTPS